MTPSDPRFRNKLAMAADVLKQRPIFRELKGAAEKLRCPIVVMSRLPRNHGKAPDKTPELSDLHGTPEEAVEWYADTVMFLHREDDHEESASQESEARLIVAKNNGGQTGEVPLLFQRESGRFRDG